MTRSLRIRGRRFSSSSEMPSAKYSCSLSGLIFTKGSTAMELSVAIGAAVAGGGAVVPTFVAACSWVGGPPIRQNGAPDKKRNSENLVFRAGFTRWCARSLGHHAFVKTRGNANIRRGVNTRERIRGLGCVSLTIPALRSPVGAAGVCASALCAFLCPGRAPRVLASAGAATPLFVVAAGRVFCAWRATG